MSLRDRLRGLFAKPSPAGSPSASSGSAYASCLSVGQAPFSSWSRSGLVTGATQVRDLTWP